MRLPLLQLTKLLLFVCGLSLIGAGCQSSQPVVTASPPARNTELARLENDRAFKLVEDGKYLEAEPLITRAIAADDQFGPAHNNLGLIYYHTSRLYKAAWEFESAIKLMPSQPEPRNNLGLVYEKAGKLEDAITAYDKARAMQPDNPEFIGNLTRARIQRGDKDGEVRNLLDEIVVKDTRPEWRHWARLNLFRLHQSDVNAASTRPLLP